MKSLRRIKWLAVVSMLTILLFVKVSPATGFVLPYGLLIMGMISGDVGGLQFYNVVELLIYLTPLLLIIAPEKLVWGLIYIIPALIIVVYLATNINPKIYINLLSTIPFLLVWIVIIRKIKSAPVLIRNGSA